jgi:hypothetical protein
LVDTSDASDTLHLARLIPVHQARVVHQKHFLSAALNCPISQPEMRQKLAFLNVCNNAGPKDLLNPKLRRAHLRRDPSKSLLTHPRTSLELLKAITVNPGQRRKKTRQ